MGKHRKPKAERHSLEIRVRATARDVERAEKLAHLREVGVSALIRKLLADECQREGL